MAARFNLICGACGDERAALAAIGLCETCRLPYDVAYADEPSGDLRLPLANPNAKISYGDGKTPLTETPRVAAMLGVDRLYAKLEYYAPTGSFKDRGSAVLIAGAVEDGVTEFIEDSSGNAGASLAAYAARAGVKATIYLPRDVSKNKLAQIEIYGARPVLIEGTRQNATAAAQTEARRVNGVYLSHNFSPYFIEGMKSFIYELDAEFIDELDAIVFPVGNGSLLIGAWIALGELRRSGAVGKSPALYAVQSEAICPAHLALGGERDYAGPAVTIASGISVSAPARLRQIVAAVSGSGGAAAVVSDAEIKRWQRTLARSEGIFCEATAAVAFAGVERLLADDSAPLNRQSTILIPITGSGLKEPLV